jgi:hypothetical protein
MRDQWRCQQALFQLDGRCIQALAKCAQPPAYGSTCSPVHELAEAQFQRHDRDAARIGRQAWASFSAVRPTIARPLAFPRGPELPRHWCSGFRTCPILSVVSCPSELALGVRRPTGHGANSVPGGRMRIIGCRAARSQARPIVCFATRSTNGLTSVRVSGRRGRAPSVGQF